MTDPRMQATSTSRLRVVRSGCAMLNSFACTDAGGHVCARTCAGRPEFHRRETLTSAVRPRGQTALEMHGADGEPVSYCWPLAPFDRQHPVRAFFCDPRIGAKGSKAFHFGIDVSGADGTPVYAVQGGIIDVEGAQNIAVVEGGGASEHGYWHIVPAVKHGQHVAQHQLHRPHRQELGARAFRRAQGWAVLESIAEGRSHAVRRLRRAVGRPDRRRTRPQAPGPGLPHWSGRIRLPKRTTSRRSPRLRRGRACR